MKVSCVNMSQSDDGGEVLTDFLLFGAFIGFDLGLKFIFCQIYIIIFSDIGSTV